MYRKAMTAIFFGLLLGSISCRPTDTASPPAGSGDVSAATLPKSNVPNNSSSTAAASPVQIGKKAAQALAKQLTSRLTEAMSDGGPAEAIAVCSQQAPRVAEQIGTDFGVTIGRTSFKVRNPRNKPPGWAEPLVRKRVDKLTVVDLPTGGHGVLMPIRLKAICMMCHGPVDQIAAPVREAIKKTYPEDQATGFQTDDLRGWFWVEVPGDKH